MIGRIALAAALALIVIGELVARRADRKRREREAARWADNSPEAARARLDASRGRW